MQPAVAVAARCIAVVVVAAVTAGSPTLGAQSSPSAGGTVLGLVQASVGNSHVLIRESVVVRTSTSVGRPAAAPSTNGSGYTVPVRAGQCYSLVGASTGTCKIVVTVAENGTARSSLQLHTSGTLDRTTYCAPTSQNVEVTVHRTGTCTYAIAFADP